MTRSAPEVTAPTAVRTPVRTLADGTTAADAAPAATVVLVGGHESGAAEQLRPWAGPDRAFRAVPAGRALADAVAAGLDRADLPVCVVPMTRGRDPALVADAARTLGWLSRSAGPGRIALARPLGAGDHLVGWLRAAAGRVAAAGPPGAPGQDTALLVTAPAADAFQDAELFRIARLVRQHGPHRWVEVAFDQGDPGLSEGVDRCRRLGASRVVLLRAAFGPAAAGPVPGTVDGGPLLTRQAVAGVLAARVDAALQLLRTGRDGIAAGLDAEHGQGFAHTHGHPQHDHHHTHDRAHHHAHDHAHPTGLGPARD